MPNGRSRVPGHQGGGRQRLRRRHHAAAGELPADPLPTTDADPARPGPARGPGLAGQRLHPRRASAPTTPSRDRPDLPGRRRQPLRGPGPAPVRPEARRRSGANQAVAPNFTLFTDGPAADPLLGPDHQRPRPVPGQDPGRLRRGAAAAARADGHLRLDRPAGRHRRRPTSTACTRRSSRPRRRTTARCRRARARACTTSRATTPGSPGTSTRTTTRGSAPSATNFQAWPGLYTVTDTAPTQVGVVAVAPGSTQVNPVQCDVSPATTAADAGLHAGPHQRAADLGHGGQPAVTIEGTGFGASQGTGPVTLAQPSGTAVPTTLPVASWSDDLDHRDRAAERHPGGAATGDHCRQRQRGGGRADPPPPGRDRRRRLHPDPVQVNPPAGAAANSTAANRFTSDGTVSDTNPETVLQRAVNRASALPGNALLVVWPNATNGNNPTGDYFENVVVHATPRSRASGPAGSRTRPTSSPAPGSTGWASTRTTPPGTNWVNTVTGLGYDARRPCRTPQWSPCSGRRLQRRLPGIAGRVHDHRWLAVPTSPTNIDTTLRRHQHAGRWPRGPDHPGRRRLRARPGDQHRRSADNVIVGNSGSYGGGIRVGTPVHRGPERRGNLVGPGRRHQQRRVDQPQPDPRQRRDQPRRRRRPVRRLRQLHRRPQRPLRQLLRRVRRRDQPLRPVRRRLDHREPDLPEPVLRRGRRRHGRRRAEPQPDPAVGRLRAR